MSSESKSSPRRKAAGRKKPSASGTSKRTRKSPRSSAARAAPVELLEVLSGVLSRKRVRWYLFGAQAVNAYGIPRLTADVDVTIEAPGRTRGALFAAMERAGFKARVQDPEAFAKRTHVVPFVFAPSGLLVDVVLAGAGIEQAFLDRARELDVGGTKVPVLSFEDLERTDLLPAFESLYSASRRNPKP